MGSADIVPGVSGGTVALVLGIYDQLIRNISQGAHALKQMLTRDVSGAIDTFKRIEWVWLFSLLAGILAAIIALSSVIETLLHEQPIRMSALFFGLILGSIWVALRMLDKIDGVAIALMLGIGGTMFLLLGLRSDTEVADTAAEIVTKPWWVFFLAGAIAICAMILPGISGSFILVMLGMYTEVLGAVNDRDFTVLIAFALGLRRRSCAVLDAAQLAARAVPPLGARRDDRPDARLDPGAVAVAERDEHHHDDAAPRGRPRYRC